MWIYVGYATNTYFLVLFAEWPEKQQGREREGKNDKLSQSRETKVT